MLPGLVIPMGVVARLPVDITYQSFDSSAVGATTYTFTAMAIGAAATNRKVVVGIWNISNPIVTASTVTIGGISATLVVGATNTLRRAEFWVAEVPTGTTANVVITWSGAALIAGAAAWRLISNGSATAFATASDVDGSNPQTGSINVPDNGGAIGFTLINATTVTSTWSGLTEDFDQADANSDSLSGASLEFATAQTPLAISNTMSSSPATNLTVSVFASWGP